MNEIKLNIDQISEELYLLILEFFDDWEIKAKAEK